MNIEITFLNILFLLLSLLIITAGIIKTKSSPVYRKYFIYIFSVTAAISFVIFQIIAYTYLLKFNFYYGINSALFILVISAIIISPFTFRLINTAKLLFITTGVHKPVTAFLPADKTNAKIISAEVKDSEIIESEVIEPEIIEQVLIELEKVESAEILTEPINAETVIPHKSEITEINSSEKEQDDKRREEEHKPGPVKKQAVKHKSSKKRTPVQKTVSKRSGSTQQNKKPGRKK